jgi:hypothetical protein
MVRKLSPVPIVPDGERIVFDQGMGFVDVPRTRTLLEQLYRKEAATWQRPRGWVDEPSMSILQLYYLVYGGYADMLMARGDTAAAMVPDSIAELVRRNFR